MENLENKVYDSLKQDTDVISEKMVEIHDCDNKIKSGRYSKKTCDEYEVRKKLLRKEVEADVDNAIKKAVEIVKDYQNELRVEDDLKPEELTDDIRLFNAGIVLSERDIKAILARNADNPTMQQICLRYAEQNGIETGLHYVGNKQKIHESEQLFEVINYYSKWMATDRAAMMLDKFFVR